MQNKFTFGIIGAMECEVNSLKSKLQNLEELTVGTRIFYVGELNSHKIILVQSGVGKVNSAICVQYIIDKFNPDFIINTGIAGGLGENMGPPADESPLGNNAQNPTYIDTVWGYGYKWGF